MALIDDRSMKRQFHECIPIKALYGAQNNNYKYPKGYENDTNLTIETIKQYE